jgi:periplasmic divalent cation tolerance protein
VFVTAANRQEAENISQKLLNDKLIACANIIENITSFFHWKGQIDCGQECLVIMKSSKNLFAELVKRVKELHSYEVPEILALPVVDGSEAYLSWMNEALDQRTF